MKPAGSAAAKPSQNVGANTDAAVTPLGNSLPTLANGSMAPIAPDIPAQIRTIRALRDEAFDVVHLHEPLAPGPTATAMFFKTQPLVGTFHAAGGSLAYEWLRPGVRWLVQRLDVRCAVSEDAKAMAQSALGGDYRVVFNGIDKVRLGAESGDHAEHIAHGCLLRLDGWGYTPGCPLEEIGVRAFDTEGLAGHRVAANEADCRRQELIRPFDDVRLG